MAFGVRRVGVRSFYRGQFPAHGLSTVTIDLDPTVSVLALSISSGLSGNFEGGGSAKVLEVSLEGTLVTIPVVSGGADVLQLSAEGTLYVTPVAHGEATVLQLQMESSGYVQPTGSLDRHAVVLSMSGSIVQDAVIAAADDTEYPNIAGETYIVVNLRTKAHSTYRDGERTATARTAAMNFDSFTQKAVSDIYLHSRAKGVQELLVTDDEATTRSYDLDYGSTRQPAIGSKRKDLAKGRLATSWEFEIVVPEDAHMEIRGMDLLVSDTKRHRR